MGKSHGSKKGGKRKTEAPSTSLSWRGAAVVCAIVIGVVILMAALGMFQYIDG